MHIKTNAGISITPSLVIEYLYCPRFIYFMEVLKIDQNEDKRYKVTKGREIHHYKSLTNVEYRRKKLGVEKKLIEEELFSSKYRIHGKVDEVLFLSDGTASPLDYKYAKYKGRIFKTYKIQSIMYGLLIKENYNVKVNKGFIVYTRSNNHIEEILYKEKDVNSTIKIIDEICDIIKFNFFPKSTSIKRRCLDCCYRNICAG